jgi:hypothetical protein
LNVQDVKDSFYAGLRDRIAAMNPARTVVVRGAIRPAVLVVENELPLAEGEPLETFQLVWSDLQYTPDALLSVKCGIAYAVNGSAGATETASSVLGRGRALAAMDAELLHALGGAVRSVAGITVGESNGVAVQSAASSRVFWGDVTFGAAVAKGDRISRIASVEVFGYGI